MAANQFQTLAQESSLSPDPSQDPVLGPLPSSDQAGSPFKDRPENSGDTSADSNAQKTSPPEPVQTPTSSAIDDAGLSNTPATDGQGQEAAQTTTQAPANNANSGLSFMEDPGFWFWALPILVFIVIAIAVTRWMAWKNRQVPPIDAEKEVRGQFKKSERFEAASIGVDRASFDKALDEFDEQTKSETVNPDLQLEVRAFETSPKLTNLEIGEGDFGTDEEFDFSAETDEAQLDFEPSTGSEPAESAFINTKMDGIGPDATQTNAREAEFESEPVATTASLKQAVDVPKEDEFEFGDDEPMFDDDDSVFDVEASDESGFDPVLGNNAELEEAIRADEMKQDSVESAEDDATPPVYEDEEAIMNLRDDDSDLDIQFEFDSDVELDDEDSTFEFDENEIGDRSTAGSNAMQELTTDSETLAVQYDVDEEEEIDAIHEAAPGQESDFDKLSFEHTQPTEVAGVESFDSENATVDVAGDDSINAMDGDAIEQPESFGRSLGSQEILASDIPVSSLASNSIDTGDEISEQGETGVKRLFGWFKKKPENQDESSTETAAAAAPLAPLEQPQEPRSESVPPMPDLNLEDHDLIAPTLVAEDDDDLEFDDDDVVTDSGSVQSSEQLNLLQVEIQRLKEENASLNNSLVSIQAEHENVLASTSQLQETVDRAEETEKLKAELQDELETLKLQLKTEAENAESMINAADQAKSEVQSKLDVAEAQLEDLSMITSSLEAVRQEKSKLELDHEKIKSQLDQESQQFAEQLKLADEAKVQLQTEIETTKAQLEESAHAALKMVEVEQAKQELENQLEAAQAKFSSETSEIETKWQTAETAKKELESELELTKQQLKSEVDASEQLAELRGQLATMTQENATLATEFELAKAELAKQNEKPKKKQSSKSSGGTKELKEVDPQLFDRFEKRLKAEYRKRKTAQKFLAQAEEQRDEIAKELHLARKELNETKADQRKSDKRTSRVEEQLSETMDKLKVIETRESDLEKQSEQHERELDSLRKKLDKSD